MRVYSSSGAGRERCTGWCGPRAARGGPDVAVLLLLPGRRDHLPDPGVDQAVDLAVEVDRALESGVGAAVVVVVQLLAGHAHLLDDVLFLDPRAEDVGLVQLDQLLRLVVADIVDDDERSCPSRASCRRSRPGARPPRPAVPFPPRSCGVGKRSGSGSTSSSSMLRLSASTLIVGMTWRPS